MEVWHWVLTYYSIVTAWVIAIWALLSQVHITGTGKSFVTTVLVLNFTIYY